MFKYAKEVNKYLLKIQQGDKLYYEPLYERTANHLHTIAQFYLNNRSLAWDVVIDVFVKIMSYIHSYDSNYDGFNWLWKITQNTAYTYNKSEERIAKAECGFAHNNQFALEDKGLSKAEFLLIIDPLDAVDKEIAIARFCFDNTLQEIGDKFGVSKVTIHQRISKICKFLDENIKKK